jgi:hypothetical protein
MYNSIVSEVAAVQCTLWHKHLCMPVCLCAELGVAAFSGWQQGLSSKLNCMQACGVM